MNKILPAILSHDLADYQRKLEAVAPLSPEVHVDLMDGVFVANKTISAKDVRSVQTPVKLEAHLMVQDPTTWIEDLAAAHFRRIIVHQEIGAGLVTALRLIKSLGLEAGIALNPESDPLRSQEWWDKIDLIQIMGVVPGHYGATFQPSALEALRQVREAQFPGVIQVDGGVTPERLSSLVSSGAKSFVVGHFLFGEENEPQFDKIGEKLESLRAALGTP